MEVEYIKDLRHNYMVIAKEGDLKEEPYCIKMLKAEGMDGILSLEQRNIDNRVLYYYDITSKQAINNLLEKSAITYGRIKKLLLNILGTIEKAYEYLLYENDFCVSPDMIFMDLTTEQLSLCYLPGYHIDIKEQLCSLMEYFMNKVDYNDKEAVLLVYNLYAASKEEGFTFDYLVKVINTANPGSEGKQALNYQNSSETSSMKAITTYSEEDHKSRLEMKHQTIIEPSSIMVAKPNPIPTIPTPFMMEKLSSEQEIMCYPWTTYLYTGICTFFFIISILISLKLKIIYNSLGNRIDVSKLFALLLILFCIFGYLMTKIWDKKNRIAKIIQKQEYIDPRTDIKLNNGIKNEANDNLISKQELSVNLQPAEQEDEIYNPTCLLSSASSISHCYLKPMDVAVYETITVDSFPFFIGKLKKNVDYCLEKDVVSRYHAKITMEQEQYYITDMNSTNGTFLNEEVLQTYQPKELKDGDEIAFANIKYRFVIQG